MHPCARIGYLYLLADAWQTDDCTIPTDPIDLADKSGLGDELWSVHGPRILRKFDAVEGTNKLRNAALFKRWEDAKKVYDGRHADPEETRRKRSEAGRKGNERRWGKGEGSQDGRKCDGEGSQNTPVGSQTDSYTETGTETGTKEQTPIAPSDDRSPLPIPPTPPLPEVPPPPPPAPKVVGRLPLNDGSLFEITDAMVADWAELYPAVDVTQECKSMKGWCIGNPTKLKTPRGVLRFITSWLEREQDRGGTKPLPLTANGGHNAKPTREQLIAQGNARLAQFAGTSAQPS